ncbi:MAG: carotenoid 1,2-hydratase [Chloroflexi bacterium]|nr:carotenoid 1,2-hydratase [Chloroflexota bacterium]
MLKVAFAFAVVIVVALIGFSLINGGSGESITASAEFLAPDADASLFARADAPYDWDFPRDYGSHNAFQTEWWYYTGNVADAAGRRFGYQFTVFRRAIAPASGEPASASEFRTTQVYMAHFTLSDIASQRFFHEQRFSRGGVDLAFALPDDNQPSAPYRVALENWQVRAADAPDTFTLTASSTNGFSVDFTLTDLKGPVLQGDAGLSAKSSLPGSASYYYSQPRLLTEGTLTIGEQAFTVSGATWMDHEFSTSALGENALGWDWFGLHFDDGRELMIGQIRLLDGGKEPAFGGLLIETDGSTRYLPADQFTITSTAAWTSPHTSAVYPSGWQIEILGDGGFDFAVTPLQPDQELYDSDPSYWEGAVALSGSVTGYGYAELTGYVQAMTRRF